MVLFIQHQISQNSYTWQYPSNQLLLLFVQLFASFSPIIVPSELLRLISAPFITFLFLSKHQEIYYESQQDEDQDWLALPTNSDSTYRLATSRFYSTLQNSFSIFTSKSLSLPSNNHKVHSSLKEGIYSNYDYVAFIIISYDRYNLSYISQNQKDSTFLLDSI